MVDLAKTLLSLKMKYVLFGKIQSDGLEGEFGVIRQLSGGNYHISVEQVISSVSLRRLKLYHKLEMHDNEIVSADNICCVGNMQDKDDDLELLDNCFGETSNLTESERSTLYYICGYICFKEDLEVTSVVATHSSESEFTELVSRGLLKHPTVRPLSVFIHLL